MKKVLYTATKTTVTAMICNSKVEITLHDTVAEFSIGDEHYCAYNAADDMLFVVLLGKGEDKNNDATWEKFCDVAGWWRCCYTAEDAKTNMDAAEELCDAIENALTLTRKMFKAQQIIDLVSMK